MPVDIAVNGCGFTNRAIVNLFKRHSESDDLFTTLPYTIKRDEVHQ